jgi:hypothetical protein
MLGSALAAGAGSVASFCQHGGKSKELGPEVRNFFFEGAKCRFGARFLSGAAIRFQVARGERLRRTENRELALRRHTGRSK